ncbi:MAG: hypothetical protein LC774_08330 [Acidobacteria bacterium]|nr:hypothetical protein [Acidobacteriota bacterium]
MDERDEFDEELIDDEPTSIDAGADDPVDGEDYLADEEDGEGDGLGDEDEEDAEVRTALLSKHEMIALISLRTSAEGGGRIVRIDPRQPMPLSRAAEPETSRRPPRTR